MAQARILVVEDEARTAESITSQLRGLGYAIAGIAAYGENAIEQSVETHPDLVLMDINLGGYIDGIEVAQEIRAYLDIPVIYLTDHVDRSTLNRAQVTEPFGYLLKPFEPRELGNFIEIALYKHHMEKLLQETEAQFRTLVEANPVMTIITRRPGNNETGLQLLYIDPAVRIITGYTVEELMMTGRLDIIHPDFRETFAQQVNAALTGHGSIQTEAKIVTKEGGERWLDCTLELIEYDDTPALLLTATDISESKKAARDRLELAAEQEKHKRFQYFINDTAHDVKTPLTAIKMGVYLLQALPDSEKREYYLTIIENQIEQLERLLGDMFNIARLDAIPGLELEPTNLNALVQCVVTGQELTSQSQNHSLSLTCDPALPAVRADKTYLNRAITNILTNALNYTPEGGSVAVRTGWHQQQAVVEIRDTGIGIGPSDLPYIFERFYRAGKAKSVNTNGSGLGLAIADKVVRMHGGTIEVESRPEEGSTFRILLPIDQTSDQATTIAHDFFTR